MEAVSLVLSGGGVRGVGHLGLLAAMHDYGIEVSAISGTSAGAIVGTLFCAGYSVNEILDFFKNSTLFNVRNIAVTKTGILDSVKYRKTFSKLLPETFAELAIPMTICASNLQSGEPVYFDKGDLITPLLASCAVPPLFSPVSIDGDIYSDGGITDNFPIDPLLINAEGAIWGSYVVTPYHVEQDQINNSFKLALRTSILSMYHEAKHKFVAAKHVFRPNLTSIAPFNTADTDKAFNISYAAARLALEEMVNNLK